MITLIPLLCFCQPLPLTVLVTKKDISVKENSEALRLTSPLTFPSVYCYCGRTENSSKQNQHQPFKAVADIVRNTDFEETISTSNVYIHISLYYLYYYYKVLHLLSADCPHLGKATHCLPTTILSIVQTGSNNSIFTPLNPIIQVIIKVCSIQISPFFGFSRDYPSSPSRSTIFH